MVTRYALCFLPLVFHIPLAAQLIGFFPPDTMHRPCAWDSTTTIFTYQQWEAYQTIGGYWNSPKDPAVCIGLAHQSGANIQPAVHFDDIDVSRPVFVRALLDSATVFPLDSNTLYQIYTMFAPSNWASVDTTGPCPDGLCSGLMLAVRIPDSAGTGHDLRWYHGEWDIWSSGWGNVALCVPTEKFATNELRELVIKITPQGSTTGEKVGLAAVDAYNLDLIGGLTRLTEASMPNLQSSPGQYEIGWGDNLVMYEDSTYPGPQAYSRLDVTPIPNVVAQTTVTITLQPFSSLYFQPFTEFRGGFVLGSDSIRHGLQVVNFGADLCLSGMVEVVWENNARYVHHDGHVDFNGPSTCMLFGKGGTLHVAEGATMHYGNNGVGVLALKTGGRIQIDRHAELVMHGSVVMYEYADEHATQDVYMTLPEGAKLTFAPGSHVMNPWSTDKDMRIFVYLDGGQVDKSGLPEGEQDRVVVVPLPSDPLSPITITGAAGSGPIDLHLAGRQDGEATLTMFDSMGRLVVRSSVDLVKGPNTIPLRTAALGVGGYFIRIEQNGEHSSGRFVIL